MCTVAYTVVLYSKLYSFTIVDYVSLVILFMLSESRMKYNNL